MAQDMPGPSAGPSPGEHPDAPGQHGADPAGAGQPPATAEIPLAVAAADSPERKGQMADWIFQASAHEHDLDARIAASPERWWGTPRYRDRMAVGDRVWMQVTGPHHPGLYYVATIVSATYEHPVQPGEPAYARWRTDIRVDYRIRPPLLRSELLDDATLGSFRPFHGFQGSNVPVPPDIAEALSERAAPRLVTLQLNAALNGEQRKARLPASRRGRCVRAIPGLELTYSIRSMGLTVHRGQPHGRS